MKTSKNLKMIFAAMMLIASSAFAESWYVCLGSFSKLDNATAYTKNLAGEGIAAIIETAEVSGKQYYRVYYSKKFTDKKLAQSKKSELNALLKKTDSWLVNVELKNTVKTPVPETPQVKTIVPVVPAPVAAPVVIPEPEVEDIPVKSVADEVFPIEAAASEDIEVEFEESDFIEENLDSAAEEELPVEEEPAAEYSVDQELSLNVADVLEAAAETEMAEGSVVAASEEIAVEIAAQVADTLESSVEDAVDQLAETEDTIEASENQLDEDVLSEEVAAQPEEQPQEEAPAVEETPAEQPAADENLVYSADAPYTVLVHSYREGTPALKDMARLQEMGIDSFVYKRAKLNEVAFDLYSRAFKSESAAEEYLKSLASEGLKAEAVAGYSKISAGYDTYEVLTEAQDSTLDGPSVLPDSFTEGVKKTVKAIPAFNLYDMTSVEISCDEFISGVSYKVEQKVVDGLNFEAFGWAKKLILSTGYAVYKDTLTGKSFALTVKTAKDKTFRNLSSGLLLKDKFNTVAGSAERAQINAETFAFIQADKEGKNYLFGKNSTNSVLLVFESEDLTSDELIDVLSNGTKSETLVSNRTFRKSLLSAFSGKNWKKSFLKLSISQLTDAYAEENGSSDWANAMVGDWCYSVQMKSIKDGAKKSVISTMYDLGSDELADQIFQAYEPETLNAFLKPGKVGNYKAYYSAGDEEDSIVFKNLQFICKVSSVHSNALTKDVMINAAEQIKLFEKK